MEKHLWLPTPEYAQRRWRVRMDAPDSLHGYCRHADHVIGLNRRDLPLVQLSTLLHEVQHAVRGDDEETVTHHEQGAMAAIRLAGRLFPDLGEFFDEPRD